jgi:hypothetical protein
MAEEMYLVLSTIRYIADSSAIKARRMRWTGHVTRMGEKEESV